MDDSANYLFRLMPFTAVAEGEVANIPCPAAPSSACGTFSPVRRGRRG